MTTIAADQHSIAADGLQVWSGEIVRADVRKIVHSGPYVLGFAGCCPLMKPAMTWFLEGANPDTCPMRGDPDRSWTLLVIERVGGAPMVGKITSLTPYFEMMSFPLALGAGGEMATGAMLAGASPQRAVELVASRCDHTGGVITEINLAEVLG